jgi:hypothetical protein
MYRTSTKQVEPQRTPSTCKTIKTLHQPKIIWFCVTDQRVPDRNRTPDSKYMVFLKFGK